MMSEPRRPWAIAAAAALVGLTACGGGEEEVTSIRVADTAGMPSAFLQYGIDQGHFDEVGLEIELDVSVGGAAEIPSLVNGDTQFAGSNAVSALLAADRGLPIQIAAGGTRTSEDPEGDFARVFARADDDQFEDLEDLGEATFAVNTLENINDIALMTVLDAEGIDFSGLEFVEMGFADMLPALDSGDVDAALLIEPFVTTAMNQGFEPMFSPYVESRPGLMIGTYLTSEQFAAESEETVQAFRDGIAATAQDVADDPEAFREALPEISQIDAAAAQELRLPHWSEEADRQSLEFIAEQMLRFDKLDEPADVDELLLLD